MTPDPVVLEARGGRLPRSCALADVIRATAADVGSGDRWARGVFAQLPGLALVAVDLPGSLVAFVPRQGNVCVVRARAGLVDEVYRRLVSPGR
ncbi:hypothetical protein ACSHWB_34705 [Lentzea sp. HUAS TT2]|uniref:hypothetical protein n=1 Tax=Lentzea sp. HUAS TT2 TaxID=3447454 RepID=UPI003F70282F